MIKGESILYDEYLERYDDDENDDGHAKLNNDHSSLLLERERMKS